MINSRGDKLVGAYPAVGLKPQGIIAHDFPNLQQAKDYVMKLSNPPSHWCMYGMCNDEFVTVYEEKDGIILKNLFD